jgi:tricorn protease
MRAHPVPVLLWCLLLAACPQPEKKEEMRGKPLFAEAVPLKEARNAPGGHQLLGPGESNGYPRFPDHHGGVVVFSAEGDLWEVSVDGGLARRLTTHPGVEFFAHFSPDGKLLAFSGDYDGNQDVFVMPAVGGVPRRLTYHPGMDQVLGWTPDNRVLFRSRRDHPHGDWTPYTIAAEGGDPVRLPLSRLARLSYEPGGKRVAINRIDRDFRRWKRYAGGTATQVFVGDLEGGAFRKLTTFRGSNSYPMWHGGRVYFLSDRTGTMNIWSMTPEGGDLKQHTRFSDFDVRFPSLGDGQIAFTQRADIYLLDLKSGRQSQVKLRLVSDAQRVRTRFTDPVRYITRFDLTPDGAYLGLELRGNLHLIPAQKEGRRIAITQGSGTRERGLAFSDDGKQVAAVSDAAGENEIMIYDTALAAEPRQVTKDGVRFKYPPDWAPGGKLLAYADSDNRLYVVPAKGGAPKEVDHSPYGRISGYSFSPDGRWLAYVKVEENYFESIFLYDTERGGVTRVTETTFNDWDPTWSIDGKYLAFLSERTVNPLLDRLDVETIVDKATKPYLVLLAKETHSPFLPKPPGADKEKDKDKGKGKEKDKGKQKVKVEVDLEGIGERIVEVPVQAGHYRGLWAGKGVLLYVAHPTRGMADWQEFWFSDKEPTVTLMRFDIEKKKDAPFADEVTGYAVSRDGKKIALRKTKGRYFAFELGEKAPEDKELKEAELPMAAIREQVAPPDEWRQIFNEVWRMMRDFYFAPDMCQVDWEAIGRKYAPLLPRVATRDELEDLLGEMVAELSLGHTYIWGGDRRRAKPVPVGLLGADLEPDADAGLYRFARIYPGPRWDTERSSPLTLSHARVQQGEYLVKIDGRPIRAGDNVYSRLQKAAGELVALTVSKDPKGRQSREVEITTLKDDRPARYYTWVEHNRELVAQKTEGKVGYLHIPDMMTSGMVEFDRWFYPQARKHGLIVDARYNRGGFVSQIMVKRLMRTILSWSKARSGWVGPYPENSLHGRIVVLTNERAGSDGDIFPRAIQVGKVGPVIGTRTWGGVVGINTQNPLVDKGISTRPAYFAWWEQQRRWGVEGEGVEPDIVVDNDPGAVFRGTDAQLERGIAVVLDLLRKKPPRPPAFGDYPDKRKETWIKRYGQTDKP